MMYTWYFVRNRRNRHADVPCSDRKIALSSEHQLVFFCPNQLGYHQLGYHIVSTNVHLCNIMYYQNNELTYHTFQSKSMYDRLHKILQIQSKPVYCTPKMSVIFGKLAVKGDVVVQVI